MAKKTVKEIVWKETNTFFFTPKYKYPAPVNNRYVFVWDVAKHYRKAINFAAHFAAPNKIACLYLLGSVKGSSIEKLIEDTPGNFVVLVFPDDELLKELDDHNNLLEKYRTSSTYYRKSEGWRPSAIQDEITRIEHAISQDESLSEHLREHLENIKLLFYVLTKAYPDALQRFQDEWNSSLIVYGLKTGSIRGDDEGHFADLQDVARSLYPHGIEAGAQMPLAYKTARREKLAEAALDNSSELGIDISTIEEAPVESVAMYDAKTGDRLEEFNGCREASLATGIKENAIWRVCTGVSESTKYKDRRVCFSKYYRSSEIPKLFYQGVAAKFHRKMLDEGFVDMAEFKTEIEAPPFGYYESNWYTYLLALVLRKYVDKQYHCNVGIVSVDPDVTSIKCMALAEKGQRRRVSRECVLYKQTTAQDQYIRLLRKLFHLSSDYKTRQDVERGVARYCEKNIAVSCLDMIDSRLSIICRNATLQHWSENTDEYYYSFTYGYEDDYLWLKENFEKIKRDLTHLDEDLFSMLSEKYGEDMAKKYFKYARHSPIARSWVWDKEALFREIEWFMNNTVFCRECENMIREHEGIDEETVDPGTGRKRYVTHAVSMKDILALNRKIIDKDVTQFYCKDCLCDVCGCEPIDLFYKIQQFKEEGCTLFA